MGSSTGLNANTDLIITSVASKDQVIIDGSNQLSGSRFLVLNMLGATLRISHVTIANFRQSVPSGYYNCGLGSYEGGTLVLTTGNLYVQYSRFSGNVAFRAAAIDATITSGGYLFVDKTEFISNANVGNDWCNAQCNNYGTVYVREGVADSTNGAATAYVLTRLYFSLNTGCSGWEGPVAHVGNNMGGNCYAYNGMQCFSNGNYSSIPCYSAVCTQSGYVLTAPSWSVCNVQPSVPSLTPSTAPTLPTTSPVLSVSPTYSPTTAPTPSEPSFRFSCTGALQTFHVPSNVSRVMIDIAGAQGGGSYASSTTGGLGGRVQTTYTVTPGSTLYIFVGCQGQRGNGLVGSTVAGGWNGGGNGDDVDSGGNNAYFYGDSGGGGGATDIRTNSSLTSRLVVTGAGGGGHYSYGCTSNGGSGGGLVGASISGACRTWYGCSPGNSDATGGTQAAGGLAGR